VRPNRDALAALDGTLYVVTDRGLARGRSHVEVAGAALRGGARVIQLRDKDADVGRLVSWGKQLRKACEEYGATFVVNDRLDVARTVDAHGLHLGQSDMPVKEARVQWDGLLGATVGNVEQAKRAWRDGADHVGLSPIWATPTKSDAGQPCGLEGITAVRREVELPIVAIGGIGPQNISDVIHAGAHSAAVVSAVVAADDVEEAARRLVVLIEEARRGI